MRTTSAVAPEVKGTEKDSRYGVRGSVREEENYCARHEAAAVGSGVESCWSVTGRQGHHIPSMLLLRH